MFIQGKHKYTYKIYIISDPAPKHGTNNNYMSLYKIEKDVYLNLSYSC